MVLYNCIYCQYNTPNKFNYNKHLKTKKHLQIMGQNMQQKEEKKEEKEEKVAFDNTKKYQKNNNEHILSAQKKCQFCSKKFSRSDNLRRHISVCKLNNYSKIFQNIPKYSKKEDKSCRSTEFECKFCGKFYSTQFNLNKHLKKCASKEDELTHIKHTYETKLLEKDLESKDKIIEEQRKTIEIVQKMKPSVTHITNNNSTNKTINYLNTQYGEMIAMEKFLHNLQYEEQLTTEECRKLLTAYKDSGIELFARSFSHVMKENCRRQLLKQGLPEMDIIPLYCSDGNLRSHKEKNSKGWKTKYDNQSLNTMINISSEQVYENCQKPLMIFGEERNKVFKQLKQDNHSQNKQEQKLIEDS